MKLDLSALTEFEEVVNTILDTLDGLRKLDPPKERDGEREQVKWFEKFSQIMKSMPSVPDVDRLSRFSDGLGKMLAKLNRRMADGQVAEKPIERMWPQRFPARLTSEVGGGVYGWTRLKDDAVTAFSPAQTGVNAKEANGSTGIPTGAAGTGAVVWLEQDATDDPDEWRFAAVGYQRSFWAAIESGTGPKYQMKGAAGFNVTDIEAEEINGVTDIPIGTIVRVFFGHRLLSHDYWFEYEVGIPSDSVEDETTWGLAPDPGESLEYSRGDHTHGSPPEPAGLTEYEAGAGIEFTGGGANPTIINVDLAAVSGLEFTVAGNAGELRVLPKPDSALAIEATGLAWVPDPLRGLDMDATGAFVKLEPTCPIVHTPDGLDLDCEGGHVPGVPSGPWIVTNDDQNLAHLQQGNVRSLWFSSAGGDPLYGYVDRADVFHGAWPAMSVAVDGAGHITAVTGPPPYT
ncbi:MAG: hypothetical protein IMZ50_03925 [Candidatus Atribacteria bacterium]|nr:hypothetical protein [Candidatus Atribacteria bacterium]